MTDSDERAQQQQQQQQPRFAITPNLPPPVIRMRTEAYLSEVEEAVTDLLHESGLARNIADHMRDYFQLDFLDRIGSETDVGRIFELIHHDPWTNDERVAHNGLYRIASLLVCMDDQEQLRSLLGQRHHLPTVLLPRMAAHHTNDWLLCHGIAIVSAGLPHGDGGIPNAVPDGAIGAWEWDDLFGVSPDAVDSIVRAMVLHGHNAYIHAGAAHTFFELLLAAEARREEIVTRLVQAPEGNNEGIAALFRALQTMAGDSLVVAEVNVDNFLVFAVLDILRQIDDLAPGAMLEYAASHPDWRAIVADTDPDCRPDEGGLLGVPFEDF